MIYKTLVCNGSSKKSHSVIELTNKAISKGERGTAFKYFECEICGALCDEYGSILNENECEKIAYKEL